MYDSGVSFGTTLVKGVSLKVAFIFLEVYYLDLEYLASMSETLSTSPNELLTARNSCINLVDARRAVLLRDYLFYTLIEISNY